MHKMENWAHRLFPKLQFDEFVDKVERLGKKKEVQVRSGPRPQACVLRPVSSGPRPQTRVLRPVSICLSLFSVQTCLKRIRLDMPLTHEDYLSQDGRTAQRT